MQSYKYLIIGGGAAGVSAAETIRRYDITGSLAIVSDEPYLMYSRVMLSKPSFFLGKIPFDQIYLKKEDWYKSNNIGFIGGKKAISLNPAKKVVSLSDGSELQYDKLLIATGVDARKWSAPGADKKGIHYLRNMEDGKGIMEAIKTTKQATIIGGGFIGFEMADLLRMAGIETTMILRESYFWEPTLDPASGTMIENALTKGGVKILKNTKVAEVQGNEYVEGVITTGNRSTTDSKPVDTATEHTLPDDANLPCQMIICGIGVISPIDWLQKSGLKVNHGVLANEYLETNMPDIWVAGDIAEYNDLLLEEHVQMGNWVNAREQGRVAATNMIASYFKEDVAGIQDINPDQTVATLKKEPFKFVSFYTTSGFSLSIAFVGDAAPSPDRLIIPRGSPEINSYARIILANGEVEGATMINRTSEMTTISKLIEKNVKVGDRLKELGDAEFDLKRLLE